MNKTSWIDHTVVLLWGAVIAGGGVGRGVITLGGGGTGARGDASGGGTNFVGSIAAIARGGGGIGGGYSGCDLASIRGEASSGISSIKQGSQLLTSLRSLVIAESFSR